MTHSSRLRQCAAEIRACRNDLASPVSLWATSPDCTTASTSMTGKYPLIAGVWREAAADVNHGPILITIAQHGGKFQAECTYQLYPRGARHAVDI